MTLNKEKINSLNNDTSTDNDTNRENKCGLLSLDIILESISLIVNGEERPFSYLDFLLFDSHGITYGLNMEPLKLTESSPMEYRQIVNSDTYSSTKKDYDENLVSITSNPKSGYTVSHRCCMTEDRR